MTTSSWKWCVQPGELNSKLPATVADIAAEEPAEDHRHFVEVIWRISICQKNFQFFKNIFQKYWHSYYVLFKNILRFIIICY